jgi:hypothetical protein
VGIAAGQMRLPFTILFSILLSCTDKQKRETKTLDFEYFTIDVPVTWEHVKARGIDSFVGHLTLDKGDTIMFDLGWYSNSLDEEYKFKVENGDVYLKNQNKSSSNLTFYEFYGKADTVDLEKFKVNKIMWTKVDGKRAKIVQPRETGKGITGIYFDSLWTAGSGTDRFQMSGTNLHRDNETRLLQAFETLKFKK